MVTAVFQALQFEIDGRYKGS